MQQFNLKLQQAIVELQQNNLKSNLRKWKINIKIMLEEFKVQLPVTRCLMMRPLLKNICLFM